MSDVSSVVAMDGAEALAEDILSGVGRIPSTDTEALFSAWTGAADVVCSLLLAAPATPPSRLLLDLAGAARLLRGRWLTAVRGDMEARRMEASR